MVLNNLIGYVASQPISVFCSVDRDKNLIIDLNRSHLKIISSDSSKESVLHTAMYLTRPCSYLKCPKYDESIIFYRSQHVKHDTESPAMSTILFTLKREES